jgi:hypothetical protein
MKTSEKLDKLAPALTKAQAEMGGAVKESSNPFFKSKYADLTSVWKACKEALHSNGFSVVQSPITKESRLGVSTMLLHESGQYITDDYTLSVKKQNDPQADGSSITYARRYALAAFVGVCPVDDDAEAAMLRNRKPATKSAPKEDDTTRYLKKLEELTKDYPAQVKEIEEHWQMDLKNVTNLESQKGIINEITGKLGKKA